MAQHIAAAEESDLYLSMPRRSGKFPRHGPMCRAAWPDRDGDALAGAVNVSDAPTKHVSCAVATPR